MSHPKRTGHQRWHIQLPGGLTRLQAAHGSIFGAGGTGSVSVWSDVDGAMRFSRGEAGANCEGFAVLQDALVMVLARRKHAETWARSTYAFNATTGQELGHTDIGLEAPLGNTCVAATQTHLFVSLAKSAELLGIDDQGQEAVLLALEPGLTVSNLLGAGGLIVAMVTPHQGLRGYTAGEQLALSVDNAMPLSWGPEGLLAMVNGEVRCFDAQGQEQWRRAFDVSSRMVVNGSQLIAVDHLGAVHALDAHTGTPQWATPSGAKKAALLNPVVCDGHAWVLNALGKLVAFDLTDGRKAFAPNEAYTGCRGLLSSATSVFVHHEADGHSVLTAFEMSR